MGTDSSTDRVFAPHDWGACGFFAHILGFVWPKSSQVMHLQLTPEFKHLRDCSISWVQESKLHLKMIAKDCHDLWWILDLPLIHPDCLNKQTHICNISPVILDALDLEAGIDFKLCRGGEWILVHTHRSYQKHVLLLLPSLVLFACLAVFRVPWGKITAFPITLHTPLKTVTVELSCKWTLEIGLTGVKHMPWTVTENFRMKYLQLKPDRVNADGDSGSISLSPKLYPRQVEIQFCFKLDQATNQPTNRHAKLSYLIL